MVRLRRRIGKRRHGQRVYEYKRLSIEIPRKFHHLFEQLEGFNFEMDAKQLGPLIKMTLRTERGYNLTIMDLKIDLAKEWGLEILLKPVEGPELRKIRSSILGTPFWPPIKRPDIDQSPQ